MLLRLFKATVCRQWECSTKIKYLSVALHFAAKIIDEELGRADYKLQGASSNFCSGQCRYEIYSIKTVTDTIKGRITH